MIQLSALGGLDLRSADGHRLQSILAQPKRVALLAYLAIARSGGYQARDLLLTLFWPESSQERARRALNQSLYVLRSGLGDAALLSQGGEVAVDPQAVSCDVVAFEQALEARELAAAMELYRGDLLPGFHVQGAPEFAAWLETERARLRGRAAAAARELSLQEEAAQNPAGAARWARRALEIAPFDESGVRRLLDLLDSTGDRAGALLEYEAYARRLAQALELEPEPETRALADAIRARADAGSADMQVAASGSGVVAAAPGGAARRRRGWLALAGVLVTLAVALGAFAMRFEQPAASAPERIAVLPFRVEGDERFAYLAEGAADLLSLKLAVPGRYRVVEPRRLLSALDEQAAQRLDPEGARLLAGRFGAGRYVLGTVVEAGGRIELRASLYDDAGELRASASASAPDEGGVLDALDALARGLLAHEGRPDGAGADVLAATPLPALKSYLQSEQAMRAGRYHDAVAALQRAVALDSTFALGYYRLAVAADWAGRFDLLADALERASQLEDRLLERERLLVHALRAIHLESDAAVAERAYRTLVARDPGDLEALTNLVDIYFHQGHWGVDRAEVRAGFERIVAVDPHEANALLHLVRLAAADRRLEDLDSLAELALSLGPDGLLAIEIRALGAFTLRDGQGMDAAVAAFRRLDDERLERLTLRTIAFSGELRETERLARLLTAPEREPPTRAWGHGLLAALNTARGRPRAAATHLASATALDAAIGGAVAHVLDAARIWGLEGLGLNPPAGGRADPAAHTAGSLRYGAELMDSSVWSLWSGLAHAQRGSAAGAARAAATLDAAGQHADAAVVRAAVARADGRPEEALRLIGLETRVTRSEPVGLEPRLRAELLFELGRYEESWRWYDAMVTEPPLAFLGLALAHLRRGEIAERLGRPAAAAAHYARFLELWADCEPEQRWRLGAVRTRMAALETSG